MTEVQKELNKVYQMISSLAVSGDTVDVIAAVRAKLRFVSAELDKMEAEENEE